MKKLSLYVFLVLLWCNIGFAYGIKMCLTSFKLPSSDCTKRVTECIKLGLSEKQCSEKIRNDLNKEMVEKALENLSEEQKEELGKKIQGLFEEDRESRQEKLEKKLEEKKRKEESDSKGR